MHLMKSLYMNTGVFTRKARSEHKNILRNKLKDIKSTNLFQSEWSKPKTGVNFNDNIIFTTEFLSEDFKKKLQVKKTFEILKRNEKTSEINLEGLSISDNHPAIDSVLFNISLLKYNLNNVYLNKALKNITQSIDILNASKFSYYDPLMISLRLDKVYVDSYTSESFPATHNGLLEEIANGYLIEDPSIIITGYNYLIRLYYYFNFFSRLPPLFEMTYEVSKKYKIKNSFVKDELVKSYLLNMYKKHSKDSLIAMHSNPAKMHVLYDLREHIEIYREDPADYFTLLEKLNRTIKYFQENEPNDPIMWQFLTKKWVISNRIGREATAGYYLEQSRSFINSHYNLSESFIMNDFNRETLLECITYRDFNLANYFFKKNIKIGTKLNFLNLVYKSLNAQFSALNKEYATEVQYKLEEFVKSHDKFFQDDKEQEFKNLIFDNLKGLGYKSVLEHFQNKEKEQKKRV